MLCFMSLMIVCSTVPLCNLCFSKIKLYWNKLYLFMSQPPLPLTPPKRHRPNNPPNIYCRFSSILSLQLFQAHRATPAKANNLMNTEESSHQQPSEGGSIIGEIESLGLTPVPKVTKVYHCRKCFKELHKEQKMEEVCDSCIYLGQLMEKEYFQQFVRYLAEFKVGTKGSYRQSNKLRRIESIQSIQSFTDRIHDSQIRPSGRSSRPPEVLNSVENTLVLIKQTSELPPSGYFCDGCSVEPIMGRRFHCLVCEDFDLCEKCYFYMGHKHDMKSFKDQPQNIASKAHLGAVKSSTFLQNTLPFLSQSIRDFQRTTQLFRTTNMRRI